MVELNFLNFYLNESLSRFLSKTSGSMQVLYHSNFEFCIPLVGKVDERRFSVLVYTHLLKYINVAKINSCHFLRTHTVEAVSYNVLGIVT
jgi:hypothetical protein